MNEEACKTCGKILKPDESAISVVPGVVVHLRCATLEQVEAAEDAAGLKKGALSPFIEQKD